MDPTLQERLQLHRDLHLHDAVVDDLREVWEEEHPDGEEPWDTPLTPPQLQP